MKRYLRVYFAFIRNCLAKEMEFKVNFLVWSGVHVAWMFFNLIFFGIIYLHVDSLGDWSVDEMIVFLGFYHLFDTFVWMMLYRNMLEIPRQINRGEYDLVLTKPVDSQFFSSTRRFSFHNAFSLPIAIALIIIGLNRLNLKPDLLDLLSLAVLLASSVVIIYSVWLISVTFSFWFDRLENIQELFTGFWDLAKVPQDVFQGVVRYLLSFIIPVALVVTFPAKIILGEKTPFLVLLPLGLSLVLLVLSRIFWQFALKRYQSASS